MFKTANPAAVENNARHSPVANTAAVVTLAADTEAYHVIDSIHASFDAAPAAAKKINVTFGGVEKWGQEVAVQGTWEFLFPRGLYTGTKNEAVVITLAADTGGASGRMNVSYR